MTPAQAIARLLVEVTDAAIAGCNASNGATLPVDLRVIGHVITMSADVVRWVNHDAGDTLFRWDHATRAETSGPLAPWRARLVALLAELEPVGVTKLAEKQEDDMPKLALRRLDEESDWYIIERHEEPGEHREWMEKAPGAGYMRFMTSARLSDADVEGSAAEMLDIAEAIKDRRTENYKRCAVEFRDGAAYFWSPRNTNDPIAPVSLAGADALAALIRARLTRG